MEVSSKFHFPWAFACRRFRKRLSSINVLNVHENVGAGWKSERQIFGVSNRPCQMIRDRKSSIHRRFDNRMTAMRPQLNRTRGMIYRLTRSRTTRY